MKAEEAKSSVESAASEACESIQTSAGSAKVDIVQTAQASVQSASDEVASAAESAKSAAVQNIMSAGETAKQAVVSEKNTAVKAVQDASAAEQQTIQSSVSETIEEKIGWIPFCDMTTTEDVTQVGFNKSIDGESVNFREIMVQLSIPATQEYMDWATKRKLYIYFGTGWTMESCAQYSLNETLYVTAYALFNGQGAAIAIQGGGRNQQDYPMGEIASLYKPFPINQISGFRFNLDNPSTNMLKEGTTVRAWIRSVVQ